MANTVTIRTTVPGAKQAAGEVNSLKTAFTGLGSKSAGPLGGAISGLTAMFNPAVLAAGAVVGVSAALAGGVKSAIEEEKSLARLDQALENNVDGWDGNRDAIDASIESSMKLGFQDDALRDSLGKLVTQSGDVEKSLRDQALAMDIARARNIDLSAATDIVVKANMGNVGALRRMGIEMDANATAAEINAELLKRYGGQAVEFAETTEGAMVAANIAMEEAAEDIGELLLPAIKDAAQGISNDLVPAIKQITGALGEVDAKLQDDEFMNFNRLFPDILPSEVDQWLDPITGAWADLFGNGPKSLQADIDLSRAGTKIMQEVIKVSALAKTAGMEGFEEVGVESGNSMEEGFLRGMQTFKDATERQTMDAMDGIADTIRGSQDTLKGAMEDLMFVTTNPMKRMKEIARVEAAFASRAVQDGLNSNDAGIRAAANDAVEIMADQYSRLAGVARREGESAVAFLERVLGNFNPPAPKTWVPFRVKTPDNPYTGKGFSSKGFSGGRARGGPINEGDFAVVGEEGPELIQAGRGGVHVYSNAQSKMMANSPSRIMVNVRLSTREFASQSRHNAVIQSGWGGFR